MKPRLFIVCGHLGVGKTTTANLLGEMIKGPVISVDQTIKALFETPSNVGIDRAFNDFEIKVCYNTFALVAEYLLSSNISLIVDGAFAKRKQRYLLISLAKKMKVPFHVLYVDCPSDIVKERASKRFESGKGVGWQAHTLFRKTYEPIEIEHYTVDTSKDVKPQLEDFLHKIEY